MHVKFGTKLQFQFPLMQQEQKIATSLFQTLNCNKKNFEILLSSMHP